MVFGYFARATRSGAGEKATGTSRKERALGVRTATTLGYGDITLSEQWRLLGAFEAMGGLILFAASTAFLMALAGSVLEETAAE